MEALQEMRFAVLVCDRLFNRVTLFAPAGASDEQLRVAMVRLFEFNVPDLAIVSLRLRTMRSSSSSTASAV